MRIALTCDWYAPRVGGIESHLLDLAAQLREAGHEPEVITATQGPPRVDGIPVHRLALRLLPGWDVAFTPSAALAQLRERLSRGRFDLVHGHSLYSPLAHASMYVARTLRIPSVLSSHSLLSPGGVLGFSWWNRVQGWGRWPTLLTAVSSLAAAETRVASGRERVHVLSNGIVTRPRSEAPRDGRPTVISVMRLCKRKLPLELVHAIPLIDAQLAPEERPQLVLVGDGPERARVERLVQRLGVGHRLERTGSLPRDEVRARLERADVFVLPTLKEAFGIAVLEARAAGLPVVAMQGNGTTDLVEHGREGLLAGSRQELADHVAELCRNAALRKSMSAAARDGLERFSWDAVLARHLEIYALACGAPAPSLNREAA
jgi:glycosyltransferase involved in cell wall biosynthesis